MADAVVFGASVLAISCAVILGPITLIIRAVLRRYNVGITSVRRWQRPVSIGVGAGLIAATIMAGLLFGAAGAQMAAVLGILSLLATLDLAWRWLPFAMTLPLLALGIISAAMQDALPQAAIGLAVGAGTLLALQLTFQIWRGVRALGTGDIWLAAGLGTLAGMPAISWILCLGAMTALIFATLPRRTQKRRMGVAYGAHLCLAYGIFVIF